MPFTGTWRSNPEKAEQPKKPFQFEIGNGMYRCLTCDPKLEVKADGQDQPVTGDPEMDTANVKIVNDHTFEMTSKKGAKIVETAKMRVSSDGNHAVFEFTIYPMNGSAPVTGNYQTRRVGTNKPGMHAASGSWLTDKVDVSDNGKEFTYQQTADGLSIKDPTGFGYVAKFDGKDYPVTGTASLDRVVVKRINDHTIEEIFKYKGKVKHTNRVTVSLDGKTLTTDWQDAGFSGKDVAEKK